MRLSTGFQAGLDPFHHRFPIADPRAGRRADHDRGRGRAEGDVRQPRRRAAPGTAHLVVPHREVRALERDLAMIAQAAQELGDHEVVPHLLDRRGGLRDLRSAWPSASDTAVSRLALGYVNPIGAAWIDPTQLRGRGVRRPSLLDADLASAPPPRPLEPLPAAALDAVRTARTEVAQRLERLKQDYPPVGRLALTGHAHIDLAWLWPVPETRRKGRRTFATVLDLMERYPDFTFNQSSAQLYAWIEEDAPDLFARVKERVAEGPLGADRRLVGRARLQITGGESFVRQLLYGQRSFEPGSASARPSPGCRTSSASRAGFPSSCAAPGSTASSPSSSTGTREPCSPTTSSPGKGSTAAG